MLDDTTRTATAISPETAPTLGGATTNPVEKPAAAETPGWRQKVSRIGSRLWRWLNYVLVIAAIVFTAWQLKKGGDAFGTINYHFDFRCLALVLALHAGGLALGSLGWAWIVRALSPGSDLARSMQVYYITNLPKNIPGSAWHILGRLYFHQHRGDKKTGTAIAMALELMLTALASALVYLFSLLASPSPSPIPPIYPAGLLVVGSLLLLPPIFNRISSALVRRLTGADAPRVSVNFGTLCLWLGLYTFLILLGGLILFLTINVIYPMAWDYLPPMAGAWSIALMITTLTFWIPINLRLRDGILMVALTPFLPAATALAVVVIWRFGIILSESFWALVVASASLLLLDQDRVLWAGLLERFPRLNSRLRRQDTHRD